MQRPIITTIQSCFLGQEFIKRLTNESDCDCRRNAPSKSTSQTHLYLVPPESHKFQTHISSSSDKDQGLQRELPTTGIHSVVADSRVANPKSFALIGKQSTHSSTTFSSNKQPQRLLDLDQLNKNSVEKTLDCSSKYPSQASIST
jgi:hypothetical protein